jgi:large subunit ribosomal protein L17
MRKRNKGRKLSRRAGQRKSLLKSLAREFFLREKIKTTEAKAKEISSFVERQIQRGKTDNLSSRRLLARHFSPDIVKKIVEEISPRYKDRKGGYTRIVKLGPRKSDAAREAIIELVK